MHTPGMLFIERRQPVRRSILAGAGQDFFQRAPLPLAQGGGAFPMRSGAPPGSRQCHRVARFVLARCQRYAERQLLSCAQGFVGHDPDFDAESSTSAGCASAAYST